MQDDLTQYLNLPLPYQDNTLLQDVSRLRDALSAIDLALHQRVGMTEVNAAIAALVNGAPGALDQLNELAAAMGNDANFAATITNALAGKLSNAPATATTLGGIKVGSGLAVTGDGTLSIAGSGSDQSFDIVLLVPSTNGQTVFTPVGGYVAGRIDLYLNGVLLVDGGDDYTATNGVNITLTTGVNTTDLLVLRRWSVFQVANTIAKSGDTMTGAFNEAPPVTAPSAATLDIGAIGSNNITVTGTTAITALGTYAAGGKRTLTFAAALVLTHNAASLILPGGANITTAAGDVAEFVSLGSGNWRCIRYVRADGTAISGVTQQYADTGAALYSPTWHMMINL